MASLPRRSAPAPQRRALVCDADGGLGAHLVEELLARDVSTWALTSDAASRELGAATVLLVPQGREAWRAALERIAPTHVFLGRSARARGTQLEDILAAAGGLEPAPRLVLCSSLVGRRSDERLLRTSGLPVTLARHSIVLHGESTPLARLAARLLRPLLVLVRTVTLGARGHALEPLEASELAYGLVHAGLGYSTIGRVVQGQELRRLSASAQAYDEPRSRRDGPRH